MQQLYDEDLVESVVFLCASGRRKDAPPLQIRRFHHERERLYSILDPDERNAAFFRLHLSWLREWGVEKFLADIVTAFPLLTAELKALAFRKARNKSEEGAELYVNADGARHAVVAVRPERFEFDDSLVCFLNHELMHLNDMVDPAFDYSPEIHQPGQTASQQRLIRQRYRLLWDVTIDGRLIHSSRATAATLEQRRTEFDRAYSFLPDEKRAQVFESFWTNPVPRHGDLVSLASDPRELNSSHQQVPGAPCPLCGFATFHWAGVTALRPATLAGIQKHFPAWTEGQGACLRCAEIYQSTMKLELPAPVCL